MSLTLKDFIKAAETFGNKTDVKYSKNIAEELLGKYEGIVPEGKNSTQYIRELRGTGYGKIKSSD